MMGSEKPASRRRYSEEQKLQVLAECDAGGASVAKVAMARGINANVVHRWRQLARDTTAPKSTNAGQFVPVSLTDTPSQEKVPDIHIELRRGPMAVTITWPLAAAAECAAWLRALLR
jgi:transposase